MAQQRRETGNDGLPIHNLDKRWTTKHSDAFDRKSKTYPRRNVYSDPTLDEFSCDNIPRAPRRYTKNIDNMPFASFINFGKVAKEVSQQVGRKTDEIIDELEFEAPSAVVQCQRSPPRRVDLSPFGPQEYEKINDDLASFRPRRQLAFSPPRDNLLLDFSEPSDQSIQIVKVPDTHGLYQVVPKFENLMDLYDDYQPALPPPIMARSFMSPRTPARSFRRCV